METRTQHISACILGPVLLAIKAERLCQLIKLETLL